MFYSKDESNDDDYYLINNSVAIIELIDDVITNKNNKEKQCSMYKLFFRHAVYIRNPLDKFDPFDALSLFSITTLGGLMLMFIPRMKGLFVS